MGRPRKLGRSGDGPAPSLDAAVLAVELEKRRGRIGLPTLGLVVAHNRTPIPALLNTWRVMSENLDLVRSIYADWERGDFSNAGWADPGIEFVSPEGVDVQATSGQAGLAEAWRATLAAWTDLRVTVEECRELDGERVLVLHRFNARGKLSGLAVEEALTRGALLFCLRGGRVTRLVLYNSRDRALADLGLQDG